MSVVFPPLDEQLGVRDLGWSEVVAKQAVWLYGQVEDDLAEQILQQIGDINISDTTVWRLKEKWGEKIRVLDKAEAKAAKALPQWGEVVRGESRSLPRMGVAMDGVMIHIRDEGWKELKTGCVFEVEMRPGDKDKASEVQEYAHAIRNSYKAVLGGRQSFGQAMWAEACRRKLSRAMDSIVIGDGARWIWNLASEHFGSSRQAVDWYHAKEHLYRAGRLAFGEGSAEAIRWAKRMETALYEGQVWQVAQAIRDLARKHRHAANELRIEAGYFEQHERRMQYMELREDGWPIGSGMVESGGKQFRARLAGPGMRWSRDGAERVIPVRAAILSDRFDDVWEAAYNSPQN